MRFEWDPAKGATNLRKHGVSFELAERVWDDPFHVIVPDRISEGEQRWHALGVIGALTLLVVVHTYPDATEDGLVRIIGARKATPHERRRYEQQGFEFS
jgi:uncharacterized DUF497 family protein